MNETETTQHDLAAAPPQQTMTTAPPAALFDELERRVVGVGLAEAVERAQRLALEIRDDASRDLAISAGADLAAKIKEAKGLRERWYTPWYRAVERLRDMFDSRLKPAEATAKAAVTRVNDYNEQKRREAEIERQRAEAEARRIREEAERKQREAEEAARKAKEQEEARKRAEAEETVRREAARKAEEERRLRDAEEAARRDKERQAEEARQAELARQKREAEEAELKRRQIEEEDARLRQAEEAEKVGNKDQVDRILDRQQPIVEPAPAVLPVPTAEERAAREHAEREAREQREREEREARERRETADKAEREARDKAEREAAELRKREDEEKVRAAKAKQEAEDAARAAKEAEYKAKNTVVEAVPEDDRIRKATRYNWRVKTSPKDSLAGIKALAMAVSEGMLGPEFLGYDPERPDKFRPSAITETVNRDKDATRIPGIEVYPVLTGGFRAATAEVEQDGDAADHQDAAERGAA